MLFWPWLWRRIVQLMMPIQQPLELCNCRQHRILAPRLVPHHVPGRSTWVSTAVTRMLRLKPMQPLLSHLPLEVLLHRWPLPVARQGTATHVRRARHRRRRRLLRCPCCAAARLRRPRCRCRLVSPRPCCATSQAATIPPPQRRRPHCITTAVPPQQPAQRRLEHPARRTAWKMPTATRWRCVRHKPADPLPHRGTSNSLATSSPISPPRGLRLGKLAGSARCLQLRHGPEAFDCAGKARQMPTMRVPHACLRRRASLPRARLPGLRAFILHS